MSPKMKHRPRKLFYFELFLACIIFLVMTVQTFAGFWNFLNWKLYDAMVNIHRRVPEKRENVVVLTIDTKSLTVIANEWGIGWPWPRDFYAQIVRYLSSCGARAVVFDIMFTEPDIDRANVRGKGVTDTEFGDAIEESGITYLAVAAQKGTENETAFNEKVFIGDNEAYRSLDLYNNETVVFPLKVLSRGAAGLAIVDCLPEGDGIVRRYPLVMKYRDRYIASTGYSIARKLLDERDIQLRYLDKIGSDTTIDKSGMVLLNWYGRGGPDGVFSYYSFHAALVSSLMMEQGEEPPIPPEAFKGKIVIIGSNAPGLLDLKPTPLTYRALYPGLEIHATAIENFLANDFIYRTPLWIVILIMAFVSALLFLINNYIESLRTFIIVFFVLSTFILVATYLLISQNIWIRAIDIVITASMVFAGLIVSGYFSESKDKRLLRRQFERYVNDTVLEEILENPNAIDLQGRTLNATVMATDIANFTTISESMHPREVVSRLNNYLSDVSESLIENRAFINKYIGDAILAVFGAFEESDHTRNACFAALEALRIINEKIERAIRENDTPLVTRFGITSGEITMGNIGSARKTEYTIIGDTVNSAFRLEGLNKYYKTSILVSEYTKDGADDYFEFRMMDILRYKGKITPVSVYELLGVKGELSDDTLRNRDAFEKALSLYQARDFHQAKNILSTLAENGDEPSRAFIDRCENFIKNPPPPDWNGVWIMMRK